MRMLRYSLVAAVVLQMVVGDAQSDPPYSHHSTPDADHSNWMAGVSGTTPISYLSIPGTHNSGSTLNGGDLVITQSIPISGQLKAGIRVLDIRLGIDSPLSQVLSSIKCATGLWVFHGPFCQNQTFATNVLPTLKSFLNSNPTETIFMRVRLENGDIPTFATNVEAAMDAFPGLFYNGSDVNPTLDSIRGKVVLLRNYGGSVRGIAYSPINFNIQDNFDLATNADLAIKWGDVKNQFIAADTMTTRGTTYLNYITASAATRYTGFPYFYASGKSGPGDNDPALLTGYTDGCSGKGCTGGNLCLSEYFRVNCTSSGCCSVAFDGLNNLSRNLILRNVAYRTGIVMIDFPGPGLIEAIIDLSLKLSSSSQPVRVPTRRPTSKPTTPKLPTKRPTSKPTAPKLPTRRPTSKPITPKVPTRRPTSKPTTPKVPTRRPTSKPTAPKVPTRTPTAKPTPKILHALK